VTVAEQFGSNLFLARRRAGLSQEKLAPLAGLHRTEIGMLERGERTPRIDTVAKIAAGLSLDIGELLIGVRWEGS
jgi:transcriptional regulator with XRE-family HTH domain